MSRIFDSPAQLIVLLMALAVLGVLVWGVVALISQVTRGRGR